MLVRPPLRPRNSTVALIALAALLALFGLTLIDGARHPTPVDRPVDRALVRELGLTDLSLLTEARYTRHLSQADRHSAFQDHPAALEHFPSGALFPPPPHLAPDPP